MAAERVSALEEATAGYRRRRPRAGEAPAELLRPRRPRRPTDPRSDEAEAEEAQGPTVGAAAPAARAVRRWERDPRAKVRATTTSSASSLSTGMVTTGGCTPPAARARMW